MNCANLDAVEQVSGARACAGIRRAALANYGARHFQQAFHVPAHRSDAEIEQLSSFDKNIALANKQVDLDAKAEMRKNAPMAADVEKDVEAMLKRQRVVLETIAATLWEFPKEKKWPRVECLDRAERQQRADARRQHSKLLAKAREDNKSQHYWHRNAELGCLECKRCLMTVHPSLDRTEVPSHGCRPSAPVQFFRTDARLHSLRAARVCRRLGCDGGDDLKRSGKDVVVFCQSCGLYSESRLSDLRVPCKGPALKSSGGEPAANCQVAAPTIP